MSSEKAELAKTLSGKGTNASPVQPPVYAINPPSVPGAPPPYSAHPPPNVLFQPYNAPVQVLHAPPAAQVVHYGGFDSGARFSAASRPTIPPPPPGCPPNASQLAAAYGQTVFVTQQQPSAL